MTIHAKMMNRAIQLAEEASEVGEVPVGSVIYKADGTIVSENRNRVEELNDPTAHAEILTIREACQKLNTTKLVDCYQVVTLEPCAMCAQAISWARLKDLRFGAYDIKSGGSVNGARIFALDECHHKPEVYGGIEEEKCAQLITQFFKNKR